ncbi:protein neprosin [Quercus suber]|uniref:protein neprosin n=1 Tax=Quercus suber TaxID=58331 RepID=UPI0032DE32AF
MMIGNCLVSTEFGYIVDCIDINKQLAFDHPLLKDHKIQKRPRFPLRTIKKPSMFGLLEDACPSGTVPIRRTTKEDLIAIRSMSNNIYPQTAAAPGIHRAQIQMLEFTGSYTGVKGNIAVYNPDVKLGDSYAEIHIMNGEEENVNSISTGWMVSPTMYNGTGYSYFFIHWTSGGPTNTGCFNLVCPGFVQIDKTIHLAAAITNVSIPQGPHFEIAVSIFKENDGNWWVTMDGISVGYFPANIFNNFTNPGSVGWGGVVAAPNPPTGISPPMGSGLYADGKYEHSCSIRLVQYRNTSGIIEGLINIAMIKSMILLAVMA